MRMNRSELIDKIVFLNVIGFVWKVVFSLFNDPAALVLLLPGNFLFVALIDDCRDGWFPSSL